MMLANSATIFVVSHDTESIARVSNLLEDQPYAIDVVGGSKECLQRIETMHGTCAVVCGNMQPSDKLAIVTKIASRRPDLPVIVLASTPALPFAVEAMRLGASDVLHDPPLKSELEGAILRLRHSYGRFSGRSGTSNRGDKFLSQLTPRESEVLRLLLSGNQNKSIGHTLGISERTVEVHRARMMRKLGVTSFAVLIRRAIDAGVEPMGSDGPADAHN